MRHLRTQFGLQAVSLLMFFRPFPWVEGRLRAEEISGNVVFAGGSLTAGSQAGSHEPFPAQCLAILGHGWKGHNSGVEKQTTGQILGDYEAQIGRYFERSRRLNVLVLWETGEDLIAGTAPGQVADTVGRIAARARGTGFDKVVLLTSTPRAHFPVQSVLGGSTEQRRHKFNELRAIVDTKLVALYPKVDAVVPLHADGQVGVDEAVSNPVYFSADRVHLNDRGYFVVANMVAERIRAFAPRRLLPGESWTSPNAQYHFVLQKDGNLVLYGPKRGALWASDTQGQPSAEAVMEPGGDLVLYGPDRKSLWSSHSDAHAGADLRVQDDGNVEINQKGSTLWSTGTGTLNRPRNIKPPAPPAEWQEHWDDGGVHDQLLKLVGFNDDVAMYFDRDMRPEDVRWLLPLTTRIWLYTKKTYGDFGTPDDRLFAIFHKGRNGGGRMAGYLSSTKDDRNCVDLGLSHWDASQDGYIIHEVSHIVEGTSNGVAGSPAFGVIWGDSKWAEFFQHDLHVGVGDVKEAHAIQRHYTGISDKFPRPGSRWFRDFFHPIWLDHGHAQIMVNYYRMLSKHYPKETLDGWKALKYSRSQTNWGEFTHFMSGAAAKDLRLLARRAFGWPPEWEAQFKKARAEFPGVLYPSETMLK